VSFPEASFDVSAGGHVLATEVLEEIQLVAESHEDSLFHFLTADGQAVGAGAA
jgi:hypothetical protein